jgi:hypothetical protein
MKTSNWRSPMVLRWMCPLLAISLVGVSIAQALPQEDGSELEQMEMLVRFLRERIATEDPSLSPELRQQALADALEMMGLEVPKNFAQSPKQTPASMARELLLDPVKDPPSAPAEVSSEAELQFIVSGEAPGKKAPPASSHLPPTRAISQERLDAIHEVLATFPVPESYRRDPARDMPPIAQMARVLLANPGKGSPWEPTLLPVGEDLRRQEQNHLPSATGSRGYEGSAQAFQDRSSRSAARTHRRTFLPTGPREDISPGLLAAAAATLRAIPSPPLTSRGAGHGHSQNGLNLPRVVVPAGALVAVQIAGQSMELQEGSHELLWDSEIEVRQGERILLVYPKEGTIFRLGPHSRGKVESSGVRRLSGKVVKFLSKPGDSLLVFPG